MSGKPQFDDGAVINSAMEVFWRHGYAASSIDELTTAMGLSRSSLYKRFRDKDGLFQEVLSIYARRVLKRMKRRSSRHEPPSARSSVSRIPTEGGEIVASGRLHAGSILRRDGRFASRGVGQSRWMDWTKQRAILRRDFARGGHTSES